MAAKKTTALTAEERLEKALVPTDEQPYEVPENWCWTKLEKVSDVIMGQSPAGTDTTDNSSFTPLIGGAADMGELYPKVSRYTKKPTKLSQAGDIIICIRATLGRPIFSDGAYCLGRGVAALRSEVVSCEFLRLLLINQEQYLYDNATGTTFAQVTGNTLCRMPIPLPPLAEQKRIVDTIAELFADLDKAAENAQSIIDNAESRRSAILHQAFTGELTKQWRVENGLDMDSWEETPSSKLFEYVTSGSRGWAQYYSDNGAVFLRMGNLDHGTIELDMSDVQYVNLPEKAEGQRSRVKKGDILISITADVGMIGLVRDIDYEGYINQHVALARPVNTNMSEFIAWYLVSDVGFKQFRQKQRGATKVGLGLADIKSLYLKMPTLAEQREIVRILDELLADEQRIKEAAEEMLDKIAMMKKSILADAFRGKLGTNDPSDEPATELLKQILA